MSSRGPRCNDNHRNHRLWGRQPRLGGSGRSTNAEETAQILSDSSLLSSCAAIVLPGVGAFERGIANLRNGGWLDPLEAEVVKNRIPILGICLGMQLLARVGYEGDASGTDGLGWIDGEVQRLPSIERVPHVGWNEVVPDEANPAAGDMFAGLEPGRDFYFVHSYAFVPSDESTWAASTPYAGSFCSAVARDHVWGVQFHPEKSQRVGFRVLTNFIEAAG